MVPGLHSQERLAYEGPQGERFRPCPDVSNSAKKSLKRVQLGVQGPACFPVDGRMGERTPNANCLRIRPRQLCKQLVGNLSICRKLKMQALPSGFLSAGLLPMHLLLYAAIKL